MSSLFRRTPAAGGLIVSMVVVAILGGHPASAATILQPVAVPTVAVDAPLTVVASGFARGAQVFVEQCDGVSPRAQTWSATLDCDLGSSPPPVIADATGKAVFRSSDTGRAFRPFSGESPQSLFNCMPAHTTPPANSLPSFTNCQLRVSSNNTDATPDQVFGSFVLSSRTPAAATPASTKPAAPSHSSPAKVATSTAAVRHRKSSSPSASDGAPAISGVVGPSAVADLRSGTESSHHVGLFALSDRGVGVGYLLVVAGLVVCALPVVFRKRRRVRPLATGSAPEESG